MKKAVWMILLAAAGTVAMAGGGIAPAGLNQSARQACDTGDVYVDHETRLMWQDAPYGDTEEYAYKHNRSAGQAGNWRYANNYCNYSTYAGYDDWRLPKVDELVELYNKKIRFKNTVDVDFWSSSPSKGNTYWSVYAIITGQPYAHKSSDTQYIRCVRCLD